MTKEVANEHALFSPSGAHRWMDGNCPGSLAMESTCPNTSSKYAAEGTAAHTLAEWTFKDVSHTARAYLGRVMKIVEDDQTYSITVSEEMCEYVQDFVDGILQRIEEYKLRGDVQDVTLLIEEKVEFSNLVNTADQFGTVDVLIIVEYTNGECLLSVEDLKYGQGVAVVAEGNEQLRIYGRAALEEFSLIYDITKINTVIHMVRKEYISEYLYTREELESFDARLKYSAEKATEGIDLFDLEKCSDKFQKRYLNPGVKQCKFCGAKGKCPALAEFSLKGIIDDFTDLDSAEEIPFDIQISVDKVDQGLVTIEQLNEFMNAADLIEDWLKAVRGRIAAELHDGTDLPDYMLAEGKKGNRMWVSSEDAESALKSMRIRHDDLYKKTLNTPTQILKLETVKNSKRKFNKIDKLITQSDGKPSVVRKDSGKKPLKIEPVVDDFEVIEDDFDDLA